MKQTKYSAGLNPQQVEEFGRELDAIRKEVMDSRGDRDRRYILTLIGVQRRFEIVGRILVYTSIGFLPFWGHTLSGWASALVVAAAGAVSMGIAKIIENMEIAHNVLHAQWDWMKDPHIQSSTWEWDTMSPSDRWMHSHNVVHHTWTNVLGKDLDVGYGIIRITAAQPWGIRYLLQPLYACVLMILFEEGVALHEQIFIDWLEGRAKFSEMLPAFRHLGHKVWRQVLKDYIMWPSLATLLVWPFFPASPLIVFALIAGANACANIIRNVWAFTIIFCGHFPSGVAYFAKEQLENETKGEWYLRQLLGSANIAGGKLFHVMSGNLSHQIEHHLFPDMCSNRYPEIAPRIRALTDRFGLPYNTGSLRKQFASTIWKILRLSLPGGSEVLHGAPLTAHAAK